VAENFRKIFNMGNNEFYICKDCVYKNMVDDDCTVEKIHLLPQDSKTRSASIFLPEKH
jgi:predicted nucleic-acid-binding Zn-ribbon protein